MNNVNFDLLNNQNEREIIMNEERLDVLDKVKKLIMLKGTKYMTLEQVSNYYEVQKHTIETIKSRNKEELESNGMKLYSRNDIKNLIGQKDAKLEITIPNRGMILFSKRAILNVALLLKDNAIADKIKQEFCKERNISFLILDYSKGRQKNTKTVFEKQISDFIKEVENE